MQTSDALPTSDRLAATIDRVLASRRWELRVKRVVDVAAAAVLVVLLAPLLLLVALAIRLESPGPVLFRQRRWGKDERQFWFYKFRSMRVESERVAPPPARAGTLYKLDIDPRVTRVGRVIRRTSIDELPQLWNVLRGDMSLVGPRPLVLHMLEPFPELRRIRCKVRPGLTGLWQVNARMLNTHVDHMTPWDMQYLTGIGLRLDAHVLARTMSAVMSGSGAV